MSHLSTEKSWDVQVTWYFPTRSVFKMADSESPEVTNNPKKRPKLGRKREIEKQKRLKSHEVGDSCDCKRLKCFENTSEHERSSLLARFNGLNSKNEQDSFLGSLIRVTSVKRRRPRSSEEKAALHNYSYQYLLKLNREGIACEIQICVKALVSIFGVGISRVERIRNNIATTGLF